MTDQLKFAAREVLFFAVDKDGEAKLAAYTHDAYRAAHPGPVQEEQLAAAQHAVNEAEKEIERFENHRAKTDDYIVHEEHAKDHKPSFLPKVTGWAATVVYLASLGIPPVVAAMLLVQSQKIGLLGDWPMLAAFFGMSALAGLFASSQIRKCLQTDEIKRLYDLGLNIAAMIVFLLWLLSLAMAAFSVGDSSATLWSVSSEAQQSPQGGVPMWWVFLITGVLDLLAAPVLRRYAQDALEPRKSICITDNPERVYLDTRIVQKRAERDVALQQLQALKERRDAWASEESATVKRALQQLETARVALVKAHADATLSLLDDEPQSAFPTHSHPQPNGHYS